MRLLVLSLFCSALGLSHGLGANRCTWGPGYWCANIPQASECGAVGHCIKAVWEKEHVAQDDDEVCEICKEMVGEARDTLQSNETQEELRQVLEGSCDLIPVKLIAKECKTLMDDFEVQLVETLASEMNPDTVCTVSGLCNSERIDRMLQKQNFGGDCKICKKGAKKVKKQLKHMNPEQIENKMLELCGYLGSYSDACRDTVVEESQTIYEVLTQQFDEEICDLSGVCSQAFEKVPSTVLAPTEDIQCEFCEKVVKHWLDVYASNSSLAEFKDLLDGICDRLDKNNADHCKHIVDQYYIPFFEFLRNEIDPETVCSMVGLCGPGGFLEVSDDVPLTVYSRKSQSSPLVKLLPAKKTQEPLGDSKCEMCDMVMEEIFSALQDPYDQRMVKNVLETVCFKLPLPAKYERKCEDFVEAYTAEILDFITNAVEPEQACAALKLCSGSKRKFKPLPAPVPSKPAPPSCVLCEYVINTVDQMLEDKSNEKQIEEALDKVCAYLPKSIGSQCKSFVDGYTEIIIDMLTKDVSPEQVCQNLGLCPQAFKVKKLGALEAIQDPLTQKPGCVLCEYVMNTIDDMLQDKATEKEIEDALKSVCSFLPGTLTKQCSTFVSTYTALIIDMLVKDVSPDMVCTNLGLCKDAYLYLTNAIIKKPPVVKIAPPPTKDPYCTLCEVVVTDLEKSLGDAKTQKAIEEALDVLCTSLSVPVHKECEKLVAKYTEEIISLLLQEYSAMEVCREVQLCVNNDISTNDIAQVQFEVDVIPMTNKDKVGCELCEFVMNILDERAKDPGTVDMIEREVQFVCSYLPDSIADACEQFVDKWGEKIIDAVVDDEMNPKQVCAELLPDCGPAPAPRVGKCPWGPQYYCASPFHAKVCGTAKFCKTVGAPGF